jgi:MoaA/NifB/PqqE/SkfB family radical SAM enzyme
MTRSPADETMYPARMDAVNRANLRRSLRVIFSDVSRTARILAARPSLILTGMRIHLHQRKAAGIRRQAGADGLVVPVMMLISLTSRCNLSCPGCYMQQRRPPRPVPELNADELMSVVSQAADLGISVIGLVGGEPLLRRREVISLCRAFPRILFTLSTNGLLIDTDAAEDLAGCGNLVPLISIEGFRDETDRRRGPGTHERVIRACSELNRRVLFFGCAITVHRHNFDEVLGEPFIRSMIGSGARILVYIQYVPAEPGTEDLVPAPDQRELMAARMDEYNRIYPAFFLTVPGRMDTFGGCLAGGRGFVHVSPSGDLEPCPLVPLSDANLRDMSLKDALASPLLNSIRRNHRSLHADGRCLLRTAPEKIPGIGFPE